MGYCGVGTPYVSVWSISVWGWTHSRGRRRPPYCRRPGSLLSIPGDRWLFRLGCIRHCGYAIVEGTEGTSRRCHSCRRKGRKAKASRSCRWSRRSWSRCCLRRSWRTLRGQRAPTVQPSPCRAVPLCSKAHASSGRLMQRHRVLENVPALQPCLVVSLTGALVAIAATRMSSGHARRTSGHNQGLPFPCLVLPLDARFAEGPPLLLAAATTTRQSSPG